MNYINISDIQYVLSAAVDVNNCDAIEDVLRVVVDIVASVVLVNVAFSSMAGVLNVCLLATHKTEYYTIWRPIYYIYSTKTKVLATQK